MFLHFSIQILINVLTKLSHLSAHMVNCLLRKNRKSIPTILSGKNLFKSVTLQILNFIPISQLKNFSHFV